MEALPVQGADCQLGIDERQIKCRIVSQNCEFELLFPSQKQVRALLDKTTLLAGQLCGQPPKSSCYDALCQIGYYVDWYYLCTTITLY